MNLTKTASLYQDGMKPLIWSKRKNEKDGTGWFRGGKDITYKANRIPRRY
jgi:cytosolic carboxypeptidase protein 2/3